MFVGRSMLTPHSAKAWDYEAAAHLLNRAGFGGAPEDIENLRALGLEAAVNRLLETPNEPVNVSDRSWSQPFNLIKAREQLRELKSQPTQQKEKRKKLRQDQQHEVQDLRFWWLERMRETPAPLLEKMTLFWHGHFATSTQKVKAAYLMWRQNATFREHALGHFPTLLKAVSRDPAMMVYLDLQQSKRDHPNENWAREVMELFTLGIGNYTETDVKEVARAFTGYRIDPKLQAFQFKADEYDANSKTFLGQKGNFSGDDVLDLIVAQPACPRFIGKKLWKFFVEDEPSPQAIASVTDSLHRHDFQIRPVLGEIFMSGEFYADKVRRTQVKSPVQFLVESCKVLDTDLPPAQASEGALRAMGQMLLAPPNVKGWDGGKSWVSTATLLFRYNFANYLLNGTGRDNKLPPELRRETIDLAKIIPADIREKPEELVAALGRRLFQAPLSAKQADTLLAYLKAEKAAPGDETLRRLAHLMMSTPQFQLT